MTVGPNDRSLFAVRYARRTDRHTSEQDMRGYHELASKLAESGVTLTAEQAGDWAAMDFRADTAEEFIQASFAMNESRSAQVYYSAGYDGTAAFLERPVDESYDLVYRADEIENAQAQRDADFDAQFEVDPEIGLVKPRPQPPEDPWEEPEPPTVPVAESQAEADYADSWGDIEAERAQAQGEMREYVDEGTDAVEAHANSATGDVLDDIDSTIAEVRATSAGWTADDQAAFENALNGGGTGDVNPLYVRPAGPDRYHVDEPEPWPPNREPTTEELDSGVAVANEDGSTTWSPADDDNWTDPDEVRAARHQAETLEYAIGDDLVVGGVAYDRDEYMPDGEGGARRRAEWLADQGIELWSEQDIGENDPHVAGSEAAAAHYWDNGGEYPDGSHPLDSEDSGNEWAEHDDAEGQAYEAEQQAQAAAQEAEDRAAPDESNANTSGHSSAAGSNCSPIRTLSGSERGRRPMRVSGWTVGGASWTQAELR